MYIYIYVYIYIHIYIYIYPRSLVWPSYLPALDRPPAAAQCVGKTGKRKGKQLHIQLPSAEAPG